MLTGAVVVVVNGLKLFGSLAVAKATVLKEAGILPGAGSAIGVTDAGANGGNAAGGG